MKFILLRLACCLSCLLLLTQCGTVKAQRLYAGPPRAVSAVARLWTCKGTDAFAAKVDGQKVHAKLLDELVVEVLPGTYGVEVRSTQAIGIATLSWRAQAGKDYYIGTVDHGRQGVYARTFRPVIVEGKISNRPVE